MSDRIIFPEEARKNNDKNKNVPNCMKKMPDITKDAVDLTQTSLDNATKELINTSFLKLTFPKRLKQRVDPPVSGQKYVVFTFVPSPEAVPDKDGVFGYSKIRYVTDTEEDAFTHSENIIRKFDSVNENLIGYVGKDFPITASSKYCDTTKEVDIRMGMDAAAKHNFQKQKEADDKEVKEIQERQRKLIAEQSNKNDDKKQPEDIDYYLTLMVKLANVEIAFDKLAQQKKDYETVFKNTKQEIDTLNSKYPDYKEQFMKKYKESLETCGADPLQNPLIKKMGKYAV